MPEIPTVINEHELSNSFLGDMVQVCFVTRDHRRSIEGLVQLGIGPWTIRTFDPSNTTDTTYYGRPAEFSMKLCLANSANMNWEVIEPLSGPSIYRDFLEAHGEGVQHLAFNCNGIPFDQRTAAFEGRGYKAVQTGLHNGGVRFAYFESSADAGVAFEVYDFSDGASLVEPEATFPVLNSTK